LGHFMAATERSSVMDGIIANQNCGRKFLMVRNLRPISILDHGL